MRGAVRVTAAAAAAAASRRGWRMSKRCCVCGGGGGDSGGVGGGGEEFLHRHDSATLRVHCKQCAGTTTHVRRPAWQQVRSSIPQTETERRSRDGTAAGVI